MELKQINETTLKITIDAADLAERDMELKDFLVPQEKTEAFFYGVMEELDLPDNFKNSGMLSFRVSPKPDKIDVFVTKTELSQDLSMEALEELDNISTPEEFFKALEKRVNEEASISGEMDDDVIESDDLAEEHDFLNETESIEKERYVYYVLGFDTLEEVIDFAKLINFKVEASELYHENRYYLTVLIDTEEDEGYYAQYLHARLLEHTSDSRINRVMLKEHSNRLLDLNAVETLKKIRY